MTYSPSEVCEFFDISKSTLFKWEQDGKIAPTRKLSGEREYNQSHIKEIAEIKIQLLKRDLRRATRTEDIERMKQIYEAISHIKALYLNDISGLREIAEHDTVPNKIISELLIKASHLDPKDQIFREIIGLVNVRCNSLA